jgi:hypothetical protein
MTRSGKPAQNVLRTTESGNVGAASSAVRNTAGKRGDGPVYNCMKTLRKGNIFFDIAYFGSEIAGYVTVDVIYTVFRKLVFIF